jgi:hypothetical protein
LIFTPPPDKPPDDQDMAAAKSLSTFASIAKGGGGEDGVRYMYPIATFS